MKVTFEVDSIEEPELLHHLQQAQKMGYLLFEFGTNSKHRKRNLSDDLIKGYEKAMEDFFSLANEIGVVIE